SYKHYPLIPLEERIAMFEGLKYVSRVVVQESLDLYGHPQPPAPRHCGAWG
ncbi:hypothetical protein LEA_18980, partial [human gut metagenome]